MDKIAIALHRMQDTSPPEEGMLGAVHEETPANPHPVRISDQIRYSRTRSISVAPEVLERHRVTAVKDDISANAFRTLRTQVLMQMRQNGWQTLSVTSPNKGAGKSTISLNLAISFALEADSTALLVDADLRDPDVRNILELEPGPGLADYLVGKAALEDLLLHPDVGNLVILPGGAPVANTSELLRSPTMANLVRELRERYTDRLIVFDAPPILSGADVLALSTSIDATILLVEEGRTTREEVDRSFDLLRQSTVMGIVLNKSRELAKPDPIKWPKPSWYQRFFGVRS
jgi:capsular exopolysaccharide synthesis family protein